MIRTLLEIPLTKGWESNITFAKKLKYVFWWILVKNFTLYNVVGLVFRSTTPPFNLSWKSRVVVKTYICNFPPPLWTTLNGQRISFWTKILSNTSILIVEVPTGSVLSWWDQFTTFLCMQGGAVGDIGKHNIRFWAF